VLRKKLFISILLNCKLLTLYKSKKFIKLTLILGFIVSIVYGLWFLISVESWVAMVNWPYLDPYAGRTIGSIYTALAIVCLKAFKERDEWEKIENTVILFAIMCIIGIIISFFS